MTNAIDVDNVTRRFGRTVALDGASLSVPQGSVCGLLGRNGAGKTTLMSLIAALGGRPLSYPLAWCAP